MANRLGSGLGPFTTLSMKAFCWSVLILLIDYALYGGTLRLKELKNRLAVGCSC